MIWSQNMSYNYLLERTQQCLISFFPSCLRVHGIVRVCDKKVWPSKRLKDSTIQMPKGNKNTEKTSTVDVYVYTVTINIIITE